MYQLIASGGVLRLADGAAIPEDEENVDYQIYVAWRNAGGEPLPADPVVPSIEDIAQQRRQAYHELADPLFFKWQAEQALDDPAWETTRQSWLDARAAIQAQFPYEGDEQ